MVSSVADGIRLTTVFYRTPSGHETVREWLLALPQDDRRAIGLDLLRVQRQWPIGMPVCRPLGRGLWEVRSDLAGNRIARTIVFIQDGHVGVLHAFVKKTRKTPPEDLELAFRRMKEMVS